MASDIRTQTPTDYDAAEWLAPKINKNSVVLPENMSVTRPTAEWANEQDLALKQVNEAFNGLPVTARNVGGLVQMFRQVQTAPGSAEVVPLVKLVPDNTMITVEVTAHAGTSADVTGGHSVINAYYVVRRTPAGVFDLLTEVNNDVLNDGGTLAPAGTVSVAVLTPVGDEVQLSLDNASAVDAEWFCDVQVRSFPQLMDLPDAILE